MIQDIHCDCLSVKIDQLLEENARLKREREVFKQIALKIAGFAGPIADCITDIQISEWIEKEAKRLAKEAE